MKKILILMSVLLLLLSIEVFASTINFKDVTDSDWFYDNLVDIADKNIIIGYPDGTFKPNNNLKFEEFIKMIVVAVDENIIGQAQGQEWYQVYIDKALENKYITEQQKAFIGQNIDRKTMAEIIFNVLSEIEKPNTYSEDEIIFLNSKLTDLSKEDNKTLTIAGIGIICGYPDGTYKPENNLTRSETVAVINRIINKDMRLPIEIPVENNISLEDLPPVDLSHLYDYPTLSDLSIEEENQYYNQFGEDYIKTVINDYIDYMELTHNRNYLNISQGAEQYKRDLLYYLNGYKEYKDVEYSRLRSYSLSKTNDPKRIEYLNNKNDFIEDFLNKWVQNTIDNKVQVQAKFYTNKNLLHDADGMVAIRGTLRIKYDYHLKAQDIKEELDLVERAEQIYGQKRFGLSINRYSIYMDYNEVPSFEVGKWYEIDMDIVVNNQSYAQGLDEKAKLSYRYIYPIAVREIR